MPLMPGEKLLHQEEQREASDGRQERSWTWSSGRDGFRQQVQQRTTQERPRCERHQGKQKCLELLLLQVAVTSPIPAIALMASAPPTIHVSVARSLLGGPR